MHIKNKMTTITSITFQLIVVSCIIAIASSRGMRRTERCLSKDSPKDESRLCYYFYDEDALKERSTEYPIHPMILGRRSHYMQTYEPMSDCELDSLFEAMKWAPSAFNTEPWRIMYAHHGTPAYQQLFNLLAPGNQIWNTNTSVLIIVATDMYSKYKGQETFQYSNQFSTGIALGNLQYEGTARGYFVHVMTGYDKEKAPKVLGFEGNPHFQVDMIIGVGKREPASALQGKKKDKTSQRKPISELVSKDVFKKEWLY